MYAEESQSIRADSGPQGIDISTLSVQQLSSVQKQLKDEVTLLSNSFAKLRSAQAQFKNAIDAIKTGVQNPVSRDILVPLTSSMYVPGKLRDTERVVVDVGTGYYVEKKCADAIKFYEDKVEDLAGNLKGLEGVVNSKGQSLRVVEEGSSFSVLGIPMDTLFGRERSLSLLHSAAAQAVEQQRSARTASRSIRMKMSEHVPRRRSIICTSDELDCRRVSRPDPWYIHQNALLLRRTRKNS